jgi:hypothetical protein
MKQLELISEKIGLFLQEEPHQSMTLQRKGAWAQSIGPGFQSPVGKKLPVCPAINGTLHIISIIEKSKDP